MNILSNPFNWFSSFLGPQACQGRPQWPTMFGPPVGNYNLGGLSGQMMMMPGMYNGGQMGQALGYSIGSGGWGSPEMLWAFLLGQVAGQQQAWPQQGMNGNCCCNPTWQDFESELQEECEGTRPPEQRKKHYQHSPEESRDRRNTGGSGCGGTTPGGTGGSGGGTTSGGTQTGGSGCGGTTSGGTQTGGTGGSGCGGTTSGGTQTGGTGGSGCGGTTSGGTQTDGTTPGGTPTGDSTDPGETPTPTEPTPENPCEWQPQPGQNAAWASQTLADNFELLDTASGQDRDGRVSREDLQSLLADNPDAPPELRDACQLMLRNETYFNAADAAQGGTPDGLISQDDARRAAEKLGAIEERPVQEFTPAGTAEVLERYAPLIDTAKGGEADGVFGREDLQRVLQDPDTPAELKEAARQTLENSYLYNTFDHGKNNDGNLDGSISVDDLKGAQERLRAIPNQPPVEGQMTEAQAAQTLDRYLPMIDQAAGKGGKDEKLGLEDLQALAASPDLPPDLRQAVDLLIGNSAIFNHFDQAGDSNGNLDGEIGKAGLQALSPACK